MKYIVTIEDLKTLVVDKSVIINSNYSDTKIHNKKEGVITKVIDTPDDTHDEEALPMYIVKLKDNTELEIFPEEILN